MTKYDPSILRKYKISNGKVIFKLINLPDDIKDYFSGIYTNIPLDIDEIELIFDSLRDKMYDKNLFDQYLLILSDPNKYLMDIISFCPICVYKKIFSLGFHPENCSNSQIAEAVILKYLDFISNGYRHDH